MHGSGGNVDRPPNEETPERGEDALRESDALFRATFEQAAVGLSHNAPDGRWLRVNDKLCEITGYSREELTSGMTFQDITHPDDLEADVEHAQRLWAGEIDTYSMQKRYLRKDASVVWIQLTVSVVREPSGEPRYFIAVIEDASERKRAEEEHARLAAIVESSEDAIIGKTLDGIITSWNPGAQKIYGYSAEEAVGQSISMLAPPERSEEISDILERVRRGENVQHYETVRVTKGGERRDISLTVSAIKDAQGHIVGASTNARDVTERKEAERRLREAESRYRTLVEQIPAITYVQEAVEASNSKAVTYMSPQYETMLGYPAESEVIDEAHWLRTLHPEDRERVLAEEARTDETGEPFKVEYRVIAEDGRVVWVRDEATLVRDEEGHPLYWLGIQYDITEQKRAEEALRGVREAERRRLARDLHDGVLQDLSYTTAVMGLIMLDAEGTSMEEELQRAVDAVRRAAQGLRDAVNDLRLEEEVDRPFPQLVDSLVERSRSMDPGCDISLRVEEGFPSEPLGDVGVELSRVVREALTNARRHSGASSVRVMLWTEEGNLLAEVADDGRGFAAGSAPGVGLRSMRERALQLGGDLEVESALGEGTRVRVRAQMMHAALGGAPRGETGVDGEGR
jgi:PAS domain S-box-containing protein